MSRFSIEELGLVYPQQDNTIIVSAEGWNQLDQELVNIANNRNNFSYKNDGNVNPNRFWFYYEGTKTYFEEAETFFIPKPYILLPLENSVKQNDIIYADIFNKLNNKAYFLNTNEIKEAIRYKEGLSHKYNFINSFSNIEWVSRINKGSEEDPIWFPSPREVYEEECENFYNNIINKIKKDDLITAEVFQNLYDNHNNTDYCFDIIKVILTYKITTLLGEETIKGTIGNIKNYDVNSNTEWKVTNISLN